MSKRERRKKGGKYHLHPSETDVKRIVLVMSSIRQRLLQLEKERIALRDGHGKGLSARQVKEYTDLQHRFSIYCNKYPEAYKVLASRRRGQLESKNNDEQSEIKKKEIDSNSPTVIEDIKTEFFHNKLDILCFSDIVPLMNNIEFIDLAVRAKIPFTSTKNKEIAESLSKILIYLSDKKGLGKTGNPKGGENSKGLADDFASLMGPVLDDLDSKGYETLKAKADALNFKGITTMRGKKWSAMTVKNTHERWKKIQTAEEKKNSTKPPKPQ